MNWVDHALQANHHHLISQLRSGDVALLCTPTELLGWDGEREHRVPLEQVKRFAREGRDLLVFGEAETLMRLAILQAPRAEMDAFFVAVKQAIAEAKQRKAAQPEPGEFFWGGDLKTLPTATAPAEKPVEAKLPAPPTVNASEPAQPTPVPPPLEMPALRSVAPAPMPVQPVVPEAPKVKAAPERLVRLRDQVPVAVQEAVPAGGLGRDGRARERKPEQSFDVLDPVPQKPAVRTEGRDLGDGRFEHKLGFRYEVANLWQRFLAQVVDGFLLGILTSVLSNMANAGVKAKEVRLEEISGQVASSTGISKQMAQIMLDAMTNKKLPFDPSDSDRTNSLVLEYQKIAQTLQSEMMQAAILSLMLVILSTWLYYAYCESSEHQGTPGKRLLKIGVTDLDVNRINFWHASKRFWWRYGVLYAVIALGMLLTFSQLRVASSVTAMIPIAVASIAIFFMGTADPLTAFFNKKRQTAHDMLAGTLVVKA